MVSQKFFYLPAIVFLPGLFFAQASLKVEDNKKNFGFVKRGAIVVTKYVIKNSGNSPLLITGADVSCSCTSTRFPKQPLLPGQTDTVYVDFNTASVYGRQDREVWLQSNDPKGPVRLRYKGVVTAK